MTLLRSSLIIMSILTFLSGCSGKISGPDFNQQDNKVITLADRFRIDYVVPGGMSNLMGFAEQYKKRASSVELGQLDTLNFKTKDWREVSNIDVGMWDYFQGKKKTPNNSVANLSLSIDINRKKIGVIKGFKPYLSETYHELLEGKLGMNTKIRSNYPEHSEEELSNWIVKAPELNTIKINNTEVVQWHTYGESSGHHLQYYAIDINDSSYLTLRFRYSYSARNEEQLAELKNIVLKDIQAIINGLEISAM